MQKLSDIVDFRRELFFDGAVQLSWFETDRKRTELAAANFVFHGPAYHGVSVSDIDRIEEFSLIDTASFTVEIVKYLDPASDTNTPLALAIAGWGTGKSHLGLTLATLLYNPKSDISEQILQNIAQADATIGQQIRRVIEAWKYPALILPINGMDNFDLSAELSRQVLTQLKRYDLDITPIEELTPRFQIAATFVERNFDLRKNEFLKVFDGATSAYIIERLNMHDENAYKKVNEVFEIANGYQIRAAGQESPRQLIQTLCEHYCGEDGPFQNVLILFDEFGRYLEFAAEKPHIAGDAALQQLFEGVQDNAEKCLLLCFIQYELKAYVSRVSHEKRDSINRFIGRYDSGKKYYLSTNLETLFANLINRKPTDFLSDYAQSDYVKSENRRIYACIQKWFSAAQFHAVWSDMALFEKVICHGCWPLHPLGTWFLCKLASEGKELQQRSVITFIEEAYEKFKDKNLPSGKIPWTISAVQLCSPALIEELLAAEEYGHRGAVAHSYIAAQQRFRNDLSNDEQSILIAVLISVKTSLKAVDKEEVHGAFALLAGADLNRVNVIISELINNYNILEWNERFRRYEIIGDAAPRSEFVKFLRKKTQGIKTEKIEEIFSLYSKNWASLVDIVPEFASEHKIGTVEWGFQASCISLSKIKDSLNTAIRDWKSAIKTDEYRGQLIYCYISPDLNINDAINFAKSCLKHAMSEAKCPDRIPVLIVLINDDDARLKKLMAEYWALNYDLSEDDKQKFSNFVKNHSSHLEEEIKLTVENMIQKRLYVFPEAFQLKDELRLRTITYNLFDETYPKIIPFPFDGFSTARGNAAKDCREITVELFKGTLNYDEWISTSNPQLKNRAVTLLETWGALSRDGKIAWIPSHSGVQELISYLDQKVQKDLTVNLGDIFKLLIMPPYGFNIASAGLMIGVFVSARKECLVFNFKQQEITPALWLGKAFSGYFLNSKVLDETFVRYISDSESSQWEALLGRWDSELTHSGRIQYMSRANDLKEKIMPPGHLYDRWIRLKENTEKSLHIFHEYEQVMEKQEEDFDKYWQREDVSHLGFIGFKLTEKMKEMSAEANKWTPDQLNALKPKIDRIRQTVIYMFDRWLKKQTIYKAQQTGDFRHRMLDQCGKNLKALNLTELNSKLEKHVRIVIARIEETEKISFIVDETQAFLDSHRTGLNVKISTLNTYIERCQELADSLNKARQVHDVSDIERLLKRLDEFKNKCENIKKQHKERASKLWNLQIHNLEDVRAAQVEVQNLMSIFDGQEMDLADFRLMDKQLGLFERDMKVLNDLSLTNRELNEKVYMCVNEITNSVLPEEELPWDTENIYNNYLKEILKQRNELSDSWMKPVCLSSEQINQMTASECQSLLNRIEAKPAYLNDEQNCLLRVIKDKINHRLDELTVDGLLVRYRQLPKNLQESFIKLAIDELKKS